MNIAIIGCGYVGTAIARNWIADHTLTVTTTTPARVPELEQVAHRVVVMKGDDAEAMGALLQNQEGVLLSVGDRTHTLYKETYLGTAKTLVAALKQSPSVQQLIYTSTCSVYGDHNGEWVDEESPVIPSNEKSQILSETEQVLLAASSSSLKVCVLRLGGIYGPNREILKIFRNIAGTTRPGTGQEPTNWIHLDDIVAALEFVRLKKLHGIYNLVHDVSMTNRELLDRLCERYALAKVSWDPSATRVRLYNARVSNKKIKTAGFKLIYPETMV